MIMNADRHYDLIAIGGGYIGVDLAGMRRAA